MLTQLNWILTSIRVRISTDAYVAQIKSNQIKLFYSAPKRWPESWPT